MYSIRQPEWDSFPSPSDYIYATNLQHEKCLSGLGWVKCFADGVPFSNHDEKILLYVAFLKNVNIDYLQIYFILFCR